MSLGEYRQIGEPVRRTLQIAREFAQVPGFWVMANPKLPAEERQRMKGLLARLPATADGQAFIKLAGIKNIRELPQAEQELLDPFAASTRAGLAPPR